MFSFLFFFFFFLPCRIGHSEPHWWEKIGKVANRAKLAISSHSEPLQWQKIGKVVNQAKLAVLSYSEPFWWKNIGKSCESGKIGCSKSFRGTSVVHFCQLSLLGSLSRSSEVECNPNTSISFFDDFGGLSLHFGQLSSLRLLSQSSEVERNPKMSISFFDDLGGLICISVDFPHLDHLADHQKLNTIQK